MTAVDVRDVLTGNGASFLSLVLREGAVDHTHIRVVVAESATFAEGLVASEKAIDKERFAVGCIGHPTLCTGVIAGKKTVDQCGRAVVDIQRTAAPRSFVLTEYTVRNLRKGPCTKRQSPCHGPGGIRNKLAAGNGRITRRIVHCATHSTAVVRDEITINNLGIAVLIKHDTARGIEVHPVLGE